MSNSYLMGAILDPLVNEFMSSAYKEGMLEAKIRTDEIRGNCPPRAGYVCVLDPRVKGGRYYRKQVQGEGVNALPPSRIEKALAQQESRSQKGEGISFLGKAAIAGGLAIGGLAAIGAIANSGRSTELAPDIPNTKKPDTSVKPKSSTYEEAKQAAFIAKTKPAVDNEAAAILPRVTPKEKPKSADEIKSGIEKGIAENERIAKQAEAIAQKLETLKQEITSKPDDKPVPLTKTTQESPDPEVTPVKKSKEKKPPVDITSMTAREASNTVIRDTYANIPDKAGAQNIGYKSAFQLKNELAKQGVIRDGAANSRADFEALLDNNMLVEEGLLVQTKTGIGKYGKNNIDAIRVPAFMPVKDLSKAASNIYSEGKGGAGITDRVERAEALVAAITEKLNKAKDLTELERNQLVSDRNRLTDKINVDNAKIKGSVIAEVNKPMGKPKPKIEPQTVIAEQPDDPTTIPLGKPAAASPVRPEPAKPQAKRQRGLAWIDAKNDVEFYDKIDNLIETDERIAKFKDRANTEAKEAVAKRLKKMYNEIDLSDPLNNGFAEDLNNAHYKIFGKNISRSVDTPVNTPMESSKDGTAKPFLPQNMAKKNGGMPTMPEKITKTELLKNGWSNEAANLFSKEIRETVNPEIQIVRLAQMHTAASGQTYDDFVKLSSKVTGLELSEVNKTLDILENTARIRRERAVRPYTLIADPMSDDQYLSKVGRMTDIEVESAAKKYDIEAGRYSGFSDSNNSYWLRSKLARAMMDKDQINNDAIASHETYYSAREQAKRDALRRFAA